MQCQLPHIESTFLSAVLEERLGLPWTLDCTFLVPHRQNLPPEFAVQITSSLGKRTGFSSQWTLHAYNAQSDVLELRASPFPSAWFSQSSNTVYPLKGDLEKLLEHCCGTLAHLHWEQDPVIQATAQWLQLNECQWPFLLRVLSQAGYWWEHPFSKTENTWCLRCAKGNPAPLRILKWQAPPPDRNHKSEILLTTSQEGLRCGETIQVQQALHVDALRIVQTKHSIDLTGSLLGHGGQAPYQVQLVLQPEKATVPIPAPDNPKRGSLRARIAAPHNDYENNPVQMDGKYPIRFDFEAHDAPLWGQIPRVQPLAGEQSALHFPLQAGTEVWLGFETGKPDEPWILGALESPRQPAPVISENSDDFIIRTRSGNQLRITDRNKKHGQWELRTAQGAALLMCDPSEQISLASADKKQTITLDSQQGRIDIRCADHMELSLDSQKDRILLQMQEGPCLEMLGAGNAVHVRSPDIGSITLEKGKGIEVNSETTVVVKSKDIQCIADKNLQLKCGQSVIQFSENGLRIHSSGVLDISAQEHLNCVSKQCLKLEGMDLHCKARSSISTQSVNLKLQADACIDQKASLILLN